MIEDTTVLQGRAAEQEEELEEEQIRNEEAIRDTQTSLHTEKKKYASIVML